MLNLMVIFICHLLDRKQPFWGKTDQKNWNYLFKMKLGKYNNLNTSNLKVKLTLSVLSRNNPFWRDLAPKVKNVFLQWNLVPRLIEKFWNQCQNSFFLFWTRNIFFWQIWFNRSKFLCLRRKLVPRLINIVGLIRWRCLLYLFLLKIPFLGKFGPKREKCLIKMKLDAKTNSYMLNSMVILICPVLEQKKTF